MLRLQEENCKEDEFKNKEDIVNEERIWKCRKKASEKEDRLKDREKKNRKSQREINEVGG